MYMCIADLIKELIKLIAYFIYDENIRARSLYMVMQLLQHFAVYADDNDDGDGVFNVNFHKLPVCVSV